ncbi:segregation and condensation protein A [Lactobacillaceae bacterium Scapto_B20]
MPDYDHQPFAIHVNEFEGPLELLLHLIKQSKMNIYDIQIESITAQYVDYLDRMKALNIDLVSEYFVMAANLMAIKSKLLLPNANEVEDDEPDPRNELVNQLLVYQVYKKHASELKQRYVQRAQLHSRTQVVPNYANGLIDNDHSLDINLLKNAFQRVVDQREVEVESQVEVHQWQYSVAEQTTWLNQRLALTKRLALDAVFDQQVGLEALITTFLALLEMIKQGIVKVVSNNQQIEIMKRTDDNDE